MHHNELKTTHDHGQKHRRDTYHLDVQFAFRVVNRGQRFQEGKHDRLGASPAANQQANFYLLFVAHSPQLGVNVCPIPAEVVTCRVGLSQYEIFNTRSGQKYFTMKILLC